MEEEEGGPVDCILVLCCSFLSVALVFCNSFVTSSCWNDSALMPSASSFCCSSVIEAMGTVPPTDLSHTVAIVGLTIV